MSRILPVATVLSLAIAAIAVGCKDNQQKSQIRSSDELILTVSNKRSVKPGASVVSTGDKPTKIYHWTADRSALNDPKSYVANVIAHGLRMNTNIEEFSKGNVGHGLYFAGNPFDSRNFGDIVVEVEVNPNSLVCILKTKFKDGKIEFWTKEDAWKLYNEYNCPAIVHEFGLDPALIVFDASILDVSRSLRATQLTYKQTPPQNMPVGPVSVVSPFEKLQTLKRVPEDETPDFYQYSKNYVEALDLDFLVLIQRPEDLQKNIIFKFFLGMRENEGAAELEKDPSTVAKLECEKKPLPKNMTPEQLSHADVLRNCTRIHYTKHLNEVLLGSPLNDAVVEHSKWIEILKKVGLLKQDESPQNGVEVTSLVGKNVRSSEPFQIAVSLTNYFKRYIDKFGNPSISDWKDQEP